MRPQYHFTAASGWINDPHGVTFRDGRYELFYQFVPDRLDWAPNCHWGHATSADLFSFDARPVALAPGAGDDGIWTGCIVQNDGEATAFYTAVSTPAFGIGRVRCATPVDAAWDDWTKGDVVVEAPPGVDLIAFRDPFVLRDGDGWRMLVGAALADGTAAALSYVSDDLRGWRYDGVTASRSTTERDPVWTGALWECPQIFELDGRHVLVTSVWDADVLHYAAYAVGELVDGRFTATHWGRLTYGDAYYAPTFFRDAEGRACLLLWLRGVRDADAGWAGAHSVPHRLRLDGDVLVAEPHPGLADLSRPAPRRHAVDGLAADARWAGSRLDVVSGGSTLVALARSDRGLLVEVGGTEHLVPASAQPVRLLVDGPIVEISTTAGIFAAAIDPRGDDLEFEGDGDLELFTVEVP
jgi:beta-fructofuranosidase